MIALTFMLLTPTQAISVPNQTAFQDGLFEFGRFVGKYSVSTDGSVSGRNISVSKEVGATSLEAAYLVLVSQGANNRDPCATSAQMTLSGEAVAFTHLTSGGEFGNPAVTAFCNYFVDITASLSASLSMQAPGTIMGFPVLYDISKYTGVALTAVFSNPGLSESGTVIYQFGHAPATGATTTISFAAIPAALPSASAILSVGIGWSVQTSPFNPSANPSTEGYNTLKVGTSGNPTPSLLSSYAGGYDDGSENNYGAEFITVGDYADNPANPTGSWVNNKTDDELYDISGFLAAGDTSLTIFSENKSVNDTIFQLVLQLKSIASGFTVTFDANGGTGTMPPQVGAGSTALSSNPYQKSGFDFAGWNTQANSQGTTYSNSAAFPFSADLTLFAQWSLAATPPPSSPPPTGDAAAYLGPVPEMLSPNQVFSSESTDVTLSGKRLQGISRVLINGIEVRIVKAANESLQMVFPPLAAGTYSVVYFSDAGTLSHQNSLTVVNRPTQLTPEKSSGTARFFVKQRFATFMGDTQAQFSADSARLGNFLRSLPTIQRITCVGSTSGKPQEASDIALAGARARVACDQARQLFPTAEISMRVSIGKGVGQYFRAVTVFASGAK